MRTQFASQGYVHCHCTVGPKVTARHGYDYECKCNQAALYCTRLCATLYPSSPISTASCAPNVERLTSPLPDIFCLALGAFVNESGVPIWTAKHLRDISPQERETMIAGGKVEIDAALQAVWELRDRDSAAGPKNVQSKPEPAKGGSSAGAHPSEEPEAGSNHSAYG
ncbi:hypothetical protein BC629DRAFT_1458502 [Irpex lacteus]|nr:hypothetical protein BC629DRAFT_1458502 [Irpex lacteus]